MLSKLLITGAILSLFSISNPGTERTQEFKYSLGNLFKCERQEEKTECYSLNGVFNPPVSSKPVDPKNLSLYDIFEP